MSKELVEAARDHLELLADMDRIQQEADWYLCSKIGEQAILGAPELLPDVAMRKMLQDMVGIFPPAVYDKAKDSYNPFAFPAIPNAPTYRKVQRDLLWLSPQSSDYTNPSTPFYIVGEIKEPGAYSLLLHTAVNPTSHLGEPIPEEHAHTANKLMSIRISEANYYSLEEERRKLLVPISDAELSTMIDGERFAINRDDAMPGSHIRLNQYAVAGRDPGALKRIVGFKPRMLYDYSNAISAQTLYDFGVFSRINRMAKEYGLADRLDAVYKEFGAEGEQLEAYIAEDSEQI